MASSGEGEHVGVFFRSSDVLRMPGGGNPVRRSQTVSTVIRQWRY